MSFDQGVRRSFDLNVIKQKPSQLCARFVAGFRSLVTNAAGSRGWILERSEKQSFGFRLSRSASPPRLLLAAMGKACVTVATRICANRFRLEKLLMLSAVASALNKSVVRLQPRLPVRVFMDACINPPRHLTQPDGLSMTRPGILQALARFDLIAAHRRLFQFRSRDIFDPL